MISAARILTAMAVAGVTTAAALTPTSSSDAARTTAGHHRADISARHGHAGKLNAAEARRQVR